MDFDGHDCSDHIMITEIGRTIMHSALLASPTKTFPRLNSPRLVEPAETQRASCGHMFQASHEAIVRESMDHSSRALSIWKHGTMMLGVKKGDWIQVIGGTGYLYVGDVEQCSKPDVAQSTDWGNGCMGSKDHATVSTTDSAKFSCEMASEDSIVACQRSSSELAENQSWDDVENEMNWVSHGEDKSGFQLVATECRRVVKLS